VGPGVAARIERLPPLHYCCNDYSYGEEEEHEHERTLRRLPLEPLDSSPSPPPSLRLMKLSLPPHSSNRLKRKR
jgi:hypothetical protein